MCVCRHVAKFQFFLGEPEISFFGKLENLDTYIAKEPET
jgi:hypothetical protein